MQHAISLTQLASGIFWYALSTLLMLHKTRSSVTTNIEENAELTFGFAVSVTVGVESAIMAIFIQSWSIAVLSIICLGAASALGYRCWKLASSGD